MARPRHRLQRVADRRVRLGAGFMLGAAVVIMFMALAMRLWVDVLLGATLAVTACRDL